MSVDEGHQGGARGDPGRRHGMGWSQVKVMQRRKPHLIETWQREVLEKLSTIESKELTACNRLCDRPCDRPCN